MEKTIILQGLTVENFISLIGSALEKKLNEKLDNLNFLREPELLTRVEAANYLKISLPTLNFWTKRGLIESYRIGTRILYDKQKLQQSLKERTFKESDKK